MNIVLIDNYDSFTYNLYQYVAQMGHDVTIVRNDVVTVQDIEDMNCQAIIISPGPGTPDEAGISKAVISRFASKKKPILGVCLGHQAIGEVFGAWVMPAPQPVHGKVSLIHHTAEGLYKDLPQDIEVGRYHSLIIDKSSLPDNLRITAMSDDGLVMGLRHKIYPVEGVQFHPESVLTPHGFKMLENFFASI